MFLGKFTYLTIDLLTIIAPLALSFDKKVAFYRLFKPLGLAMLITATVFIPWDVWFTERGVWGFNPQYITGIHVFNLPLEECLFFVSIPYACLFVYECIRVYANFQMAYRFARALSIALAMAALLAALAFHSLAYTSTTFALLAICFAFHFLALAHRALANFLVAFALSLVPFAIVNGLLTSLPIVWYNNAETLDFRLGSIPFEDLWYGMLLIMTNVTFFELLRPKIFTFNHQTLQQ